MLQSFERHSNNVALIDGEGKQSVSYEELGQLTHELSSIFPQEKVLIFCLCQNNIEVIAAYLAALQGDHAICLLDGDASRELFDNLVERYRPHFIVSVTDEKNFVDWSGYDPISSPLKELDIWKSTNSSCCPQLHPKLQLLLSTSGTTGSPKLIRLSKNNLLSNAKAIAEYLEINSEERAIASLPIHYSYGLSVLNSHLLMGASLMLTRASIVQSPFWKLFNAHQCTSFAGVPYIYQILDRLRFERFDLPSLRTMTQAGGKLGNELITKFSNLMTSQGKRFIVMYGQTEATARISYLSPKYIPEKLGAIGRAIPGGSLKIVDDGIEITTSKQVGELVYTGKNVMLGYASNKEDLAKGDELGGTLRTGDLGYFDGDGIFFLTGRLKRISKVYGLRINLDEVEEILHSFGPLAVTGTDEKLFIHFEEQASEQFPKCVEKLASQYHLHRNTFEYREIDKFPLTSSGKVDYTKLQELTNAR